MRLPRSSLYNYDDAEVFTQIVPVSFIKFQKITFFFI